MPTPILENYVGAATTVSIVSPDPIGDAGLALNNNFKALADVFKTQFTTDNGEVTTDGSGNLSVNSIGIWDSANGSYQVITNSDSIFDFAGSSLQNIDQIVTSAIEVQGGIETTGVNSEPPILFHSHTLIPITNGAMEYDGSHLYFTTANTRTKLDEQLSGDVTVTGSITTDSGLLSSDGSGNIQVNSVGIWDGANGDYNVITNSDSTYDFDQNALENIGGITTNGLTVNGGGCDIAGSANSEAIRIFSTTMATSPTNGSIEYNGSHLFCTTGGNRTQLDNQLLAGANTLSLESMNVYNCQRNLPTSLNNEVDIGSFTLTNGTAYFEIWITIPSTGYSQTKKYFFPASYNATGTAWQKVIPISTTGPYAGSGSQDFDLHIQCNNSVTSFRLQRIAGSTSATASITIIQQGIQTDTFTQFANTSSVAIPTTCYVGNNAEGFLSSFVGLGVTTLAAPLSQPLLQLNNSIGANAGSFSVSNWNSVAKIPAVLATPTNNGGSSPAAYFPALVLAREGVASQAYANFAEFRIGRYANVSTNANTGLQIALTAGNGDATGTPVLTLQSNGVVTTAHNTLDDGSGNATVTSALTVNGNNVVASRNRLKSFLTPSTSTGTGAFSLFTTTVAANTLTNNGDTLEFFVGGLSLGSTTTLGALSATIGGSSVNIISSTSSTAQQQFDLVFTRLTTTVGAYSIRHHLSEASPDYTTILSGTVGATFSSPIVIALKSAVSGGSVTATFGWIDYTPSNGN